MALNEYISLFLSFPIGLAVNSSFEQLKKIPNILGSDNLGHLKKCFYKAFKKSLQQHNKCYDENSKKVIKKLDSISEEDVVSIFTKVFINEKMLEAFGDEQFYKGIANELESKIDGNIFEIVPLQGIIMDCLAYYKDNFFNSLDDRDAILCGLITNLGIKEDIKYIREKLDKIYQKKYNFEDIISNYKKSICNNFKEINFFGLGLDKDKRKKKRQLDKIYVKPNFTKLYTDRTNKLDDIDEVFDNSEMNMIALQDIFSAIFNAKNIVVLGDPGLGKSTLVKYVMYQLAIGNMEEFDFKYIFTYIPFRIELRKYIKEKQKNNISILEYIIKNLKSEYQIQIEDIGEFEDYFNKCNTLIFFDGLDEIFDVNEKLDTRNDISNFLAVYKSSRAIVTSRIIGYDEVKFDSSRFEEIVIDNFDDNKIKEYVQKWYCQDCTKNEECLASNDEYSTRYKNCSNTLKKEISTIYEEIEPLEDEIKRNPLLLSLIIILYQNNGQIPNSKLELYKSCTKTLINDWDKSKVGLEIGLDSTLQRAKENIFSALALWQYLEISNESKKININNRNVQRQVEKAILELDITEDQTIASDLADEFLNYAEKRSIYFDNNFTHKTFLEYFTALRLFQEKYIDYKDELYGIIERYIDNPFWTNVLEMLICIIDGAQCNNKQIDGLIEYITERKLASIPFFLRIIESLRNVSYRSVKKLVFNAINFCICPEEYNIEYSDEICAKISRLIPYLMRKGNYFKQVQEAYDDLYNEMNDDNKLIRYFRFGLECNHMSVSEYKLKINKNNEYERLRKKDLYFHHEDYFTTNNFENRNFNSLVEAIDESILLFGIKSIYIDTDFVFKVFDASGMRWISLVDSINNEINNINNLAIIISSLEKLDKLGVNFSRIKSRYYENESNECMKFFALINTAKNKKICLFLADYYTRIFKTYLLKNKDAINEINQLYKDNPYREEIIRIIDNK